MLSTLTPAGTRTPSRTGLAGREWGPAKHDPDHPLHRLAAAGAGTVPRDGDDARPDDN